MVQQSPSFTGRYQYVNVDQQAAPTSFVAHLDRLTVLDQVLARGLFGTRLSPTFADGPINLPWAAVAIAQGGRSHFPEGTVKPGGKQ